jgi:hypothetical protein
MQSHAFTCYNIWSSAKNTVFLPCAITALSTAGTLPAGILRAFAPGAIVALDLSRNSLSGPLPDIGNTSASANASIANATTVFWRFSLAGNQFNGSIPDSYTALMINSKRFDLSSLPLSGQLPASLLAVAVNTSTFANR